MSTKQKNKTKKPLILVTNDDGVDAKGIRMLADTARQFGRVIMVAPSTGQSGKSHAITFNTPLRLRRIFYDPYFEIYKTNGTPTDAVKLAQRFLLRNEKIDLVISGINHGSNTATSTLYSGTVAAAMEGCINGLNAIAFSLCDYAHNCDFEAALLAAKKLIPMVLEKGLPPHTCLNVNIPNIPISEIKGFKITRQANNYWDEIIDERTDPMGRSYYWMSGDMLRVDKSRDTDEWAVSHKYISITPITTDLTAHNFINSFKEWKLKKDK